jgi:hypothetical protein
MKRGTASGIASIEWSSVEPYAMVYHKPGEPPRPDLKCFQRWTNRGLYRIVPWADYRRQTKSDESVAAWHRAAA